MRYSPPNAARPVMLVGAPDNYIQAIDSILQLIFSHTNRTIRALKPSASTSSNDPVKRRFVSDLEFSRTLILTMKKWAINCVKVDYIPSTEEISEVLNLSVTARRRVYELVQDAKHETSIKDMEDVVAMLDMIFRGLDSIVYIVDDELGRMIDKEQA